MTKATHNRGVLAADKALYSLLTRTFLVNVSFFTIWPQLFLSHSLSFLSISPLSRSAPLIPSPVPPALHTTQYSSFKLLSAITTQPYSCQFCVGKYLETLGVELGVGRIWGREGPQWSIMLWTLKQPFSPGELISLVWKWAIIPGDLQVLPGDSHP